MGRFPHQFSGGMRQRIMLAMGFGNSPDLLIADEPTTALDVTIQAQILELLKNLQQQFGMGILLITHDLGVVAEMCDSVAVMYAGRIVEHAPVETLFEDPEHPYTIGLMNAIPRSDLAHVAPKPIDGVPPDLVRPPVGCRFHPRCAYAQEICRTNEPPLIELNAHHRSACHFAGQRRFEPPSLVTVPEGAVAR
jgi:oligopeptide transport system ATP-binding protein